jgi:hypothetical protein
MGHQEPLRRPGAAEGKSVHNASPALQIVAGDSLKESAMSARTVAQFL